MADEEAEFAFQYEWWKQRQNDRGFYDLVGSLDCSAVAIKGQQESGAASSARPEVLRIYGRTSTALKGIVEDGRTIHCPSYSGYIESTTGNQAEICLSFRPPKHFRAYTGRWQNHDDELRAALYVDGSPIPNEEIFILRTAPENPVKVGHFVDRYYRERPILWESLGSSDAANQSGREERRKLSIDILSSFRLVVSRCTLESKKGNQALEAVHLEPKSEAKAKKEAMAHAGSRLSHTCTLSDARKVRDTALAARPMAVPEVINAVPLVEFIFYYKGRDLLRRFALMPSPKRSEPTKTMPDFALNSKDRRPNTHEPISTRGADSSLHLAKRVKLEASEHLFTATSSSAAKGKGHATPSQREQGTLMFNRGTGSGSKHEPIVLQDSDDEGEPGNHNGVNIAPKSGRGHTDTSAEASSSSGKVVTRSTIVNRSTLGSGGNGMDGTLRLPNDVAKISSSSTSASALDAPSASGISGPSSRGTLPTSFGRSGGASDDGSTDSTGDWKAQEVLRMLFKHSPAPEGSLSLLKEIGLTHTIKDFIEEKEELSESLKQFMALEIYEKLFRNGGWSVLNICRLFKLFGMEMPPSRQDRR